jgi:hypothetical protein
MITGVDATKLAPVIKALANSFQSEVFECDGEGNNGAISMALLCL